jgi:hypothetical protein
VIHFGQDGGAEHNGTIHLVHNTIVTPYIAPVVELSAPGARATLVNNIIWDGGSGQRNQRVAALTSAALAGADGHAAVNAELARRVSGWHNWLAAGFGRRDGIGFPCEHCIVGEPNVSPPFANPGGRDFRIVQANPAFIDAGLPWDKIDLPSPRGVNQEDNTFDALRQYFPPLQTKVRNDPDKPTLGAFGYEARKNKP